VNSHRRELGRCFLNGIIIALIIGGLLIMGLFVVAEVHALYLPMVVKDYDALIVVSPPATPRPPICPGEVAPSKTFVRVGDVAHLSGGHGISGKAIVVGGQTLIIVGFRYDGTGSDVDIRLVNGDDYGNAVAKFVHLEPRVYRNEFFILCIPNSAQVADRIVVYSMSDGVYAEGIFEGTRPRPTRTPRPTRIPTVDPKLTPTATPKALAR
jgi:hypothetical protein